MTKSIHPDQGKLLLGIARDAIRKTLDGEALAPLKLGDYPSELREIGASFVTLTLDGVLRGCVGSIEAADPLVIDVQGRAVGAAFHDPRFPALTAKEFNRIKLEVSWLTPPEKLIYEGPDDLVDKLNPGVDGVILKHQYRRATFLPQVWEQLAEPEVFLGRLCQKMGLSPHSWKTDPLEVEIYRVEKFSEPD